MNPIEVIAVILSLVFLFLLLKENAWCWIFGIVSSALSVWLFIQAKLYSESILYFIYIILGIYGWWQWKRPRGDQPFIIQNWPLSKLLISTGIGFVAAFGIGYIFSKKTDAAMPFVDAITSVFSILATWLEANKILATWIFWILVNFVTIGLYYSRGLSLYAGLMVIYFIFSIWGYYSWNKKISTN